MEDPDYNHLTSGSLIGGLKRLALPIFVGASLQNVQSLIDLFWVGKLGSSSVAALAISGTVLMLMLPVVMGMSAGTVAFISRAVGGNNYDDASDTAAQSIIMAVFLGIGVGMIGWAFAEKLCILLGASSEVAELGASYLRISFLGSFTVFVLFLGNSALQGAGNAVVPMLAMILANVINMILDPVFIFGLLGLPRMGIKGAALATVLSQTIAASLVFGMLCRGVAGIKVRQWRLNITLAWKIFKVGVPSAGQMLSRSLMALVLIRIVATYGMESVAAYGIGMRFHMIILMPAFALGNAAATMVGQNLGAKQPGRAQTVAWLAAFIDAGIMAISAVLACWLAPALISIFDSNEEVVKIGASYLRTVSPFYVFVAFAIVLGRALQGAGDTMSPMILTVLCLWGIQVPLALYLPGIFTVPTQGVWWAVVIAVTVHGIMVAGWFLLGRWKKKKL